MPKSTKPIKKPTKRKMPMGCGILPRGKSSRYAEPIEPLPGHLEAAEALIHTRNLLKLLEGARLGLPSRWRDRQIVILLKGNAEGTKATRELQAYGWLIATIFKDERLFHAPLCELRTAFQSLGMDLNYEIA